MPQIQGIKVLRKAIKQDRQTLLAVKNDHDAIAKWFNAFDPAGDYGKELFSRHLKKLTGINFTY